MYSNNIVNFQESTTILNACTKKSGNLLKATSIYKRMMEINPTVRKYKIRKNKIFRGYILYMYLYEICPLFGFYDNFQGSEIDAYCFIWKNNFQMENRK